MTVGTTPHRALALAALALACALLMAAAAPAGALDLGISDSDPPTVVEPLWAGLHVSRARVVVPYDIATTTGAAGVQRRADFETYRANAAAKGVSLLVAFGPSVDVRAPGTNDPVAPTADQFATAFAAFRARYPDVTAIAPWNEPNNRDATGYPLGDSPQLAADYWLRAQAICPSGCTLVAGDFAGIPGDNAYVDAYQAELGGARPGVWAFHAYSDVNTFQVAGASDARVTRYYLGKLQGPWAGSRIWLDEIGARYRDAGGLVWGDASQRDATELLLGLATLDPRIDAIYYYNYSNQCATPAGCAVQDRGLVSPNPLDGQPPSYDTANRARAAYAVIAGRGPVIAPVPALPPAVTIDSPAQGAALRTRTPSFAGRAATSVGAAPTVTLQLFPGTGSTESDVAAQTLSATVAGGRWAVTAAPLPDGVYTAHATQAGDPTTTGIADDVVFTIDTVPPTSAFTSAPGPVSGARSPALAFAASEPGVTFRCSLDRHASKPCSSPVQLTRLALGSHSFAIRATDAAGNVQHTPTRVVWRVVAPASALVPRLAGTAQVLARGLPLALACEDRCGVAARLELLGRRGNTLLARADLLRRQAGTFALRLRPRGTAAAALGALGSARVRLTLVLHARAADPVTVIRTVALARTGPLASLAAHGLPVTVACTSVCSAHGTLWASRALARRLHDRNHSIAGGRDGLPRGTRFAALATRDAARTRAGASDLVLRLARVPRARVRGLPSADLRATALLTGPGSPARALSWPLTLPR